MFLPNLVESMAKTPEKWARVGRLIVMKKQIPMKFRKIITFFLDYKGYNHAVIIEW